MENMKIEKQTAYNQVFEIMKDNILNHLWKVGEKIPSENELSGIFGVNRLTIRMALQRLNALGLTETRIGDGTYVCAFDFVSYLDKIYDLYSEPKLLDDVCEFRKLIEIKCSELAMQRASEDELLELEEICDKYDRLKEKTCLPISDAALNELVLLDTEFHYQICKMSHNLLFAYAFSVAKNSIMQHVKAALKERCDGWTRKGVSLLDGDFRHRAILNAIKDKDSKLCAKLYEDMIDHNIEL